MVVVEVFVLLLELSAMVVVLEWLWWFGLCVDDVLLFDVSCFVFDWLLVDVVEWCVGCVFVDELFGLLFVWDVEYNGNFV